MSITVMPITAAGKPKACMINIEGNMTIQHVKELREELLNLTCEKETLILNLGDVTSIDTSGLQFIWSFMKEARNNDRTIEIHDVSAAVFEMAYETGIEMEKILNFKREL